MTALFRIWCILMLSIVPAVSLAQSRLVSQELFPVGRWVGPYIERVPYEETVEPGIWMEKLGQSGAMLLRCSYEVMYRGQPQGALLNVWYRKVAASPAEVVAIHPAHPMALLGDRAFTECPSHEEGVRYAQESLQQFRQLAAAREAMLPPKPIDYAEPVTCAMLDNQSGNVEFYNDCTFDVNYEYCTSLSQGGRSPCRRNGNFYSIKSKERHRLPISNAGGSRAFACRAPYVPMVRVVEEYGVTKARQVCEAARRR